MRFSELLCQLSEVTDASPRHLAEDPELNGAAALDQAQADQLTFLEPGNALAAALACSSWPWSWAWPGSPWLIRAWLLPRPSLRSTPAASPPLASTPVPWSIQAP